RLSAELNENRANMIEPLGWELRRSDPRQLLSHNNLLVECRAHAAVLLGPMRRNPSLARQRVIPGHQLCGRWTVGASTKTRRHIGLEPGPHLSAEGSLIR